MRGVHYVAAASMTALALGGAWYVLTSLDGERYKSSIARAKLACEAAESSPPDLCPALKPNTDGWGGPLQCVVNSDGQRRVLFLGKDAKQGGVGVDGDGYCSVERKEPSHCKCVWR